jgi:hypothetical protein
MSCAPLDSENGKRRWPKCFRKNREAGRRRCKPPGRPRKPWRGCHTPHSKERVNAKDNRKQERRQWRQ